MIERLVVLGSTITALAVVRDAHAHGLVPVVVDDDDGIAFRSRYTQPCRLTKAAEDNAVIDALCMHGGATAALVATGDPWLRFVMRQRPTLESLFADVLHPRNPALDICLNKQQFVAWCRAQKLDAPRSWLVGAEPRPADLPFPLLVRPAQTLHGRAHHGLPKAAEVNNAAELDLLLQKFRAANCDALVSESLLSHAITQFSVPFARRGAELISFVARKRRPAPQRCSVGTFVELAPQPQVEALARRAAEALDYYGIGEVEVLRSADTGRCCLIEINARPWLQYSLAPRSGHDFLGLLVERPGPRRPLRKEGRRWVDLPSDLFGAFSSSVGAVRRGELGLLSYLSSLARANVFARLDWRDPAPAWPTRKPRGASQVNLVASG